MSPTTLRRVARGQPVSAETLSRIAPRVRDASEFPAPRIIVPPRKSITSLTWDIESVRAARDALLLGKFKLPSKLADVVMSDDAIFTAFHNRIAPQFAVRTSLEPRGGVRGAAVAKRARALVHISRGVLAGIAGTMAQLGGAVGHITREASEDGTTVEMRLDEWPMEFVEWDPTLECLVTQTRDGGVRVPIVHGDGEWVVFSKFKNEWWKREACILPAALVWVSHAEGLMNWNATAASHGQAKIIGTLPEGFAIQEGDGSGSERLSPEAEMFLQMMRDVVSGEAAAGVKPFGADAQFISNGSNAWQVFLELVQNREKAAARIYLGTDAILGSIGGAPGVDISQLFGVASTKIQGDFEAIEQAINTGLLEPWAALNEGDSRYAPRLKYHMPDPDSERASEDAIKKHDRLFKTLEQYRANGMLIDQDVVDALCVTFGIDSPPQLAPVASASVPIELAPTDVAKTVRVDEVRTSKGLPPIGDERGSMTLAELDAAVNAGAESQADEGDTQP